MPNGEFKEPYSLGIVLAVLAVSGKKIQYETLNIETTFLCENFLKALKVKLYFWNAPSSRNGGKQKQKTFEANL